jgi:hypothetical protein
VGTDTGAACHFSEREGPVLLLGDQLQRCLDQCATEIAVMIGLGLNRSNFFRHDGSMDIDNEYILDIFIVYISRQAVNPSFRKPSLSVDKLRREQ